MTSGHDARPWLLAMDTGTSRIVIAAGDPGGGLVHALDWPAAHRHGERLLPGVDQLLAETGLARDSLVGVLVGTGPGAFTGLRVGMATAKALAHARRLPIAGVGTGSALLRSAAAVIAPRPEITGAMKASGTAVTPVLLLPAGPHDRVEVRDGAEARLLPGGVEPELEADEILVAVDLAGRAPEAAVARGGAALAGLARALVELGAERLRTRGGDDVERLVPEYVTLPRGVAVAGGEIEWSHARR